MNEDKLLMILHKTEMNISRACFSTLDESWNFQTNGADYSRLYFVTDGSGFLCTDKEFVKMEPGNVYFIPAGCKFSCGCEYLQKLFFHINITTIEKYDLHYENDKIYSMPYPIEEIEGLKSKILSDNYMDIMMIKAILLNVVGDFCDIFSLSKEKVISYSEFVQNIITYIDENTSIKLKASDIARALFVSESKLRNVFLAETKIPIGKYIDDMIFIKAKRLLVEENAKIGKISAQLGFCDQFYFARRFKQKFGLTPSKYKQCTR